MDRKEDKKEDKKDNKTKTGKRTGKRTDSKRPPGRPRIKPLKKPTVREGLKKEPLKPNNVIEVIYDAPAVLKKILVLTGTMAVKKMCFKFTEQKMYIMGTDHIGKSSIRADIDGTLINHYYCGVETEMYVNPVNMQKVIKIAKDSNTISFSADRSTVRSELKISFYNDMKINEYRTIKLIQPKEKIKDVSFDNSNYQLKMEFPYPYFKKLVDDVHGFTSRFTIQKVGEGDLLFKHNSEDKQVDVTYVVTDPYKINLVSTVSSDDIFTTTVLVDYIKPLSKAGLANTIKLFADSRRDMLFKVTMDHKLIPESKKAITVNMSTKPIKGR